MMAVKGSELGVNVWWTVPEAIVDGAAAVSAIVAAGFEEKDITPATMRRAVSRACYGMQDRRSKSNRRVTEKVSEGQGKVEFGILDRVQEENKISFVQKTTVAFDASSQTLVAEGEMAEDVKFAVDENAGKVNSEDIRGFIGKVVRLCYGIRKRPSGGIYFVPAQFAPMIEQARQALDNMFPANSVVKAPKIYTERVVDGAQERANVADSMAEDLMSEVDKIMSGVDAIDRGAKALKGREGKLQMVADMAKVYEELLGKEAIHEEFAESLKAAADAVAAKMAAIDVPVVSKRSNVGLIDAAVEILQGRQEPVSVADIASELVAKGMYQDGTNPVKSILWNLGRAISNNDCRLIKIGKDMYKAA